MKPTHEQLKEALGHAEEEHHAILFLHKSDKQRYGKLIEEMENDVLKKKYHFLKTMGDMCHVLAGW